MQRAFLGGAGCFLGPFIQTNPPRPYFPPFFPPLQWRNANGTTGHSIFTSSWIAPTADCHTQQNFHYMGHGGEIRADQAHRGYNFSASPECGGTGALATLNPLYMRYTPDAQGRFAGQTGYGYRSIEAFVNAVGSVSKGESVESVSQGLASANATLFITAILEAGRRSLDAGGKTVKILYANPTAPLPEGSSVDVLAKPVGLE